MRLLEFFGSMRKTAMALGIGVATVSRWSKRIQPLKRHCRPNTMSQAVKDIIFTCLSSSPCFTCDELCQHIFTVTNTTVSRSLVLNVVHSLGFSYKRVKKRAHSSSSCKTSASCCDFRNRLLRAMQSDNQVIVSIDESGFDHRALPFYGFARKGYPAIVKYMPSNDRKRHNLLMAIANDGSRSHMVHTGTVTSSLFCSFIRSLTFPRGSIILLDNASIHKTRTVLKEMEDKGYVAWFLPPYSPEYNPIELVFGRLKQSYYRYRLKATLPDIPRTVEHILAELATPELGKACFRHVNTLLRDEVKLYTA